MRTKNFVYKLKSVNVIGFQFKMVCLARPQDYAKLTFILHRTRYITKEKNIEIQSTYYKFVVFCRNFLWVLIFSLQKNGKIKKAVCSVSLGMCFRILAVVPQAFKIFDVLKRTQARKKSKTRLG